MHGVFSVSPYHSTKESDTAMSIKQCPFCAEEIQDQAIKCKHCGSMLAPPPDEFASIGGPTKRLMRSTTDRLLAGVCGGLADYLNVDPTLVRIVYVAVCCFTALVPGLLTYLILTFVVPRNDYV